MRLIFIAGVALLVPSAVHAQQCGAYRGQVVSPLTFSQAVEAVPTVTPKDEYETTASYRARLDAAVANAGVLIIGKKLETPAEGDFLTYDADSGVLGSRLVQSQNATAAARLTADRKFLASLS